MLLKWCHVESLVVSACFGQRAPCPGLRGPGWSATPALQPPVSGLYNARHVCVHRAPPSCVKATEDQARVRLPSSRQPGDCAEPHRKVKSGYLCAASHLSSSARLTRDQRCPLETLISAPRHPSHHGCCMCRMLVQDNSSMSGYEVRLGSAHAHGSCPLPCRRVTIVRVFAEVAVHCERECTFCTHPTPGPLGLW